MFKKMGLVCWALALISLSAPAFAALSDEIRTTWRLIDYMAVDYAGAVENGEVVSEFEYEEMLEFAGTIRQRIASLPAEPDPTELLRGADELLRLVNAKASAADVRAAAHGLGSALLALHPVPTAPQQVPDIAHGAVLYQQQCASCHGAQGQGDGPAGANMEPAPIDFTDMERARQRSVFALYQVIHQGLEGTPMISFGHLPEADQWALAFYVSGLAFPADRAAQGRAAWEQTVGLRAQIPDLDALVQTSPAAIAEHSDTETADAVMAYLRHEPAAVQAADAGRLELARSQLAASVEAYRAGEQDAAKRLALSAYLDGFEPIEPMLASKGDILGRVEGAMNAYRASIARAAPPEVVASAASDIESLFDEVDSVLDAPGGSFWSVMIGALTILLREGLEALLVVVAMVAFLRKANRQDVMPYIHMGWIGALLAGFATWLVATRLISISGASRELTEGFGSLFAAVVLLTVGLWMHHKSLAGRWQQYIREKLSHALTKRSAWALAALAFVVVYREVFETILFYAALWSEGGGRPVLAGLLVGSVLLAVLAWVMLRASTQLPIGRFFSASSALIAILAFVLAGKGVAGLQEAGLMSVTPVAGPRMVWLGLFPTLESYVAQLIVVIVIFGGIAYNRIGARGIESPA
ncbi:cytochrome c/FTR1 family iron permease [Algiphilus sp. W345]|uniref:Cytochrome c/FTR1 family iron permease n=1 Tax=Banduia mediterranea TaxID=3075609 RepID=A0ABU2WN74_9GAMM|nr:cytochrome c/FTR1 family iron permease [Algiphilus sp. W345]MDT0498537.1 cytochrome c/FTR1 family iron permease [Algiphilus sp. W345]